MRVTIAGFSFYVQPGEVDRAMTGVTPEPATGACVRVGALVYPVKQVGAVISKQDRRDFSGSEVVQALQRLGYRCYATPPDGVPTTG